MQQYLEQKHNLATLLKRGIAQVNQLEDCPTIWLSVKNAKNSDLVRKLIMVLGTQVSYYKG